MTAKLTPWFPGDVKPVRVGVYQQMDGFGRQIGYQHWDGERWTMWAPSPIGAYVFKSVPIAKSLQHDPWRGLAEPPK